jgi:hypothetical protein
MRIFIFALALAAAAGCETTYEFDPVPVGEDGLARDPRPRSNTQWLRGLYSDLVGRTPASYDFSVVDGAGNPLLVFPINEQTYLLNALDGVGDPAPLRALIAAGLVRSAEVDLPEKADVGDPAVWIDEQFRKYLGRPANEYELQAFVAEWDADEAVGPRTVIRALVGSREYQSY